MVTGIGVLQPGDGKRVLTNLQIAKSDFVVLRERWKDLSPKKGQYDFKRWTEQSARARKEGKKVVLGVMTGADSTPDWLEGTRLSWKHGSRSYKNVLAPWSTSIPDAYDRLYRQIWGSFSPDMVWITGPTVPSQEMHTNGLDKQKGFSAFKMRDAWKECFDAVRTHFNVTTKVLSISGQKPVQAYMGDVIAYCQSLSTRETLAFQHNSLGPQTSPAATHHKTLLRLSKDGWPVGYELVQPGASKGMLSFPQASFGVWYPEDIERRNR